MEPFKHFKGKVAPLDRVNIDTDQIIPKQFLKLVERTGFGQYLFYDWRFDRDGKPKPNFVLNDPRYKMPRYCFLALISVAEARENTPFGHSLITALRP